MELTRRKWTAVRHARPGGFALGCALLALIFATAALAKIQQLGEFESTLMVSRLVPVGMAPAAAIGLIAIELALASSLFLSPLRSAALQAAAFLICVFLAYSAWRWAQHLSAPCHCFGVLFTMAPWQGVLLNLALLGLTTWLLAHAEPRSRPGR